MKKPMGRISKMVAALAVTALATTACGGDSGDAVGLAAERAHVVDRLGALVDQRALLARERHFGDVALDERIGAIGGHPEKPFMVRRG